jgi:hypothetical protein
MIVVNNSDKLIKNIICIIINIIICFTLIEKNLSIFLFLLFNGSLNLINITEIIKRQNVSLTFFINFFFYLFFFIVPVIHYHYNHFNYFPNSKSTFIFANKAFLALLLFNIAYTFKIYNFKSIRKTKFFTKIISISPNSFLIWILVIISLIVLFSVGPVTLFFRSSEFSKSSSDSMVKVMAFSYFFRPLIFFVALLEYKKRKGTIFTYKFSFMAIILLAIIFNFPLSTARFYTLFLLIVLLVSIYFNKKTSNFFLPILISLGVNFSFIFSNLRFLNSFQDLDFNGKSIGTRTFIDSIHFDAFEVSMLAIKYVEKLGLTFGYNILSAFLFFIPRSIWQAKADPSGKLIIDNSINIKFLEDESFTNISFPLISEFYIAFGLLGILFLAIVLRKISNYLDDGIYFNVTYQSKKFSHFDLNIILISIILGLSIFILRGTLMVAFSYTIGIIFAFFTALKICGINYKFKI